MGELSPESNSMAYHYGPPIPQSDKLSARESEGRKLHSCKGAIGFLPSISDSPLEKKNFLFHLPFHSLG